MATSISVVLCDLPRIVDNKDEIKGALKRFFDQVIDSQKLKVSVAVSFTTERPVVHDMDLLCYFVRHFADSIVAGGFVKDAVADKNDGGLTMFKSDRTVASEVYANKLKRSDDAARLVLHELMHNMSRTGEPMHRPGMAIGATRVMEGAALSAGDMKWIAKHLAATKRTQWPDGFAVYNDPMRGGL
jgi:hypothetical protein